MPAAPATVASPIPFVPAAAGPAVLVVEDSEEDFDTVREAYEEYAARAGGAAGPLCRAASGDECLELLRGAGGARPVRPAVVLMDLNTPGLDGRDALREMKADAHTRAIPVVVHTTSGSPRDLGLCYGSGANAYHVKPVSYPDHLAMLGDIFTYWLGRVTRQDPSPA